jgi:CubicO group peptidase (beta-lactamase class C family)
MYKQTIVIASILYILFTVMGVLVLAGCGQTAPVSTPAAVPVSTPTAVPSPTAAPSGPAAAPALDLDAGPKRVEAWLDKLNKARLFNGAALIAQDGKIIWSKGWGMADRQKAVPNTPQTIFRVGEMTQQFTAAATLLLEQDGRLSVRDPICNYLDDCPEAWRDIQIHHLLSHTSGIPDISTGWPGAYEMTQKGATPQQLVALFRDRPLESWPGTQRVWSGSGFVLAGLIIEHVSGQPYGDFVEQRIFEPLGMTHSGYGDPPQGLALGYANATTKTPATFNVSALYASGGCYSTAEDLFRWNEGLYTGRLLNEAELRKMLTSHAAIDNGDGSGYGIVLYEFVGRKWAGNGGGPTGYSSIINRDLGDHLTLLLIGNQDMDIFTESEYTIKSFFGTK